MKTAQHDPAYYHKRAKNNEAARKSRAKRRNKSMMINGGTLTLLQMMHQAQETLNFNKYIKKELEASEYIDYILGEKSIKSGKENDDVDELTGVDQTP